MHFRKVISIFTLLFLCVLGSIQAQTPPVIEEIDKVSGTVYEEVTIRGLGFGTDPSKIHVIFGSVPADSIVSLTDTKLIAQVPAAATVGNITIVNLTTYLTASSSEIFAPSFDGNEFDRNNLEGEYAFPTAATELYDLCLCDFNLDGANDIATSDADSKNITIFQNNKLGLDTIAFTSIMVAVDAKTRWVRCGDMNGDGLADLMLSASNKNTDKEKVYVIQNTSTVGGNISFSATPLIYTVEGNLSARMDIKDLDGDGMPELVVADLSTDGGVSIFKNNGTPGGTISFQTDPIKPFASFEITNTELSSIDIKDINNDGKPDLLAGRSGRNGIYIFANNSTKGNISFSEYTILEAPGLTSNVKIVDVDGDILPDVVVINTQYVGILRNVSTNGSLAFEDVKRFDQLDLDRQSIDFADMDGNTKPDIIIGARTNRTVVMLNHSTEGNVDFNSKQVIQLDENSLNARAGDLNGDGKPDLLYTGTDSESIRVHLNRNCVVPVLEPQDGLGVCDEFPYQLTVTQTVDGSYIWESSEDGVTFTPIANAVDSTTSYTADSEAFYRVRISSSHNDFDCAEYSNVVEVARPEGFVPSKPEILGKNPETPYCFGETIYLTAASVNASYYWTGPNGFTSNEQNPVITGAASENEGLYVLYVQASAENGGCISDTATTFVKVSEPPAIAIQSNGPSVFFTGGSRKLQVVNEAGNVYSWKKDGKIIPEANTFQLQVSEPGNYVAVIQNAQGCIRESAPFTLALAQVSIPEEDCLRETVSFSVTPEQVGTQVLSYRWKFGDGSTAEGASVTHAYTQAGSMTVKLEVLENNGTVGDSYAGSINILNLPELKITATNQGYLCPGETLELSSNEGFKSYLWNTGDKTSSITVSQGGVYELTVTAESGCVSTKEIEIVEVDAPDTAITASTDRVSLGDTIVLHAPQGVSYQWNNSSSLNDSTAAFPIARPLITTTYECIITNEYGCQTIASYTVNVDRSLDVLPQKIFTPNDDGQHDTWYIERMDLYPDCKMTIYNRQGVKLLEIPNYSNEEGWNGIINGRPAAEGVYFYLIDCGEEAGKQTGSVTIIR